LKIRIYVREEERLGINLRKGESRRWVAARVVEGKDKKAEE